MKPKPMLAQGRSPVRNFIRDDIEESAYNTLHYPVIPSEVPEGHEAEESFIDLSARFVRAGFCSAVQRT